MRGISARTLRAPAEDAPWLRTIASLPWGMAACALLLATIGVLTIHSASSELAIDFLPRQVAWVLLGLVAMGMGLLVPYRLLLRLAMPIYCVSVAAVVLVSLFGHEAGGARSWIGIAGLGGQPSDFAKIAVAVALARYLGGIKQAHLSLGQIAVATLITVVPMVPVALQPDLGGAMMFAPILVGMLLVAGVRPKVLVISALLALVFGGVFLTFGMRDYQRDRILSFVSPDRDPLGAGYQVRQSKIAVGSGAALGKGYMQGTQSKLRFLPARHTDFVFAVLAEERGFVGVLVVLGLYLLYLFQGFRITARARERSGLLLAVGLLSALCGYVLYNTAMMIGLVPVTGIPLPFLSYGGSFTLFTFFTTGVILGIDFRKYVNR